MKITTVGIDLAKSVFTIHGVDQHGKSVLKRHVRREQLLEVMAKLEPCLVGMEACSGAHHFARELARLGYTIFNYAQVVGGTGNRGRAVRLQHFRCQRSAFARARAIRSIPSRTRFIVLVGFSARRRH